MENNENMNVAEMKEQEMEGTDRLNDRYLFEVPSEALLHPQKLKFAGTP